MRNPLMEQKFHSKHILRAGETQPHPSASAQMQTDPALNLFDPRYSRSVVRNVVQFLDEHYFRSRLIGFERLPEQSAQDRPIILAGNHSGMSFPWDGIIFSGRMLRERNYDFARACRPLTAPALSNSGFMNPYFIPQFWHRAGGVDATLPNFDHMMRTRDSHVLIYPEGIGGIGKGFDRRYQLQKFSNSFLRMALKYEADIYPVLTVNGEWLDPLGYKSDALDHFVQRLGMPFLPIGPLTGLVPLQPWAFYFSLPARLTYVLGEKIQLREFTDERHDRIKQRDLNRIRSIVHRRMQDTLNQAVSEHGRDPYHLEELAEIWMKNLDRLLYILPSGWPLLFHEHERRYKAGDRDAMKHDNAAHFFALLRNLQTSAYHAPYLGWLLLFARRWLAKL